MTTAAQYHISGGSLGHTSTPALPLANSLDEGRHVNLSARLEHVCLLTPELKLGVEVPGPVELTLLEELDAKMVSGVGLSKTFSFPFFNPDVDADAPDADKPPLAGPITPTSIERLEIAPIPLYSEI